jgi:hypothetical protein
MRRSRRGSVQWSPDDVARLERAIVEGARIQLSRRGTEYVLVPRELRSAGAQEVLVGTTALGDDLEFVLDEIEAFQVIG